MKNKRSLVTGAAGFLGSHLVDQLIKLDHDVIALDILPIDQWKNLDHWRSSPKLSCVEKDIIQIQEDDSNFKEVDFVFHLAGMECAATSFTKPDNYYNTNVLGTLKVLQACRYSFVKKVVFASSFEVYGNANTPTLETDELAPISPSGLSKKHAEESLFHWAEHFDFEAVSLRIFNAYGPRYRSGESFGNGFEAWMKQTKENQPLTFKGKKEQVVDFIYCTDVANAFVIAALEGQTGQAYNIGSGKPHELQEIATLLKSNNLVETGPITEPERIWADISKFQFDSNWQPRVPLATGIEFSIEVEEQWNDSKIWDAKNLDQFLRPIKK